MARQAEIAAAVDRREPTGAPGLDWRHARPGDPVGIPGGGSGILESLPDRRGRVRVRSGTATIVVASDRVTSPLAGAHRGVDQTPHVRIERAAPEPGAAAAGGGTLHCDLRGLRVEEARDRVAEALDRALADDRAAVEFVHGVGTGALRRTVREELAASVWVTDVQGGDPDHGGDGVTTAFVSRP